MIGKLKWLFFRSGCYMELRAIKNKWNGSTSIGDSFTIGKNSILDRYMGGNISLGDNVVVCRSCKIATCGGDIRIGNNTTLGDNTTITAQGGVIIGSNVLFADKISLIAN